MLIGPAWVLRDCFASSSMHHFEMSVIWCASRCSLRLPRGQLCVLGIRALTSLHNYVFSSLIIIHCNVNLLVVNGSGDEKNGNTCMSVVVRGRNHPKRKQCCLLTESSKVSCSKNISRRVLATKCEEPFGSCKLRKINNVF